MQPNMKGTAAFAVAITTLWHLDSTLSISYQAFPTMFQYVVMILKLISMSVVLVLLMWCLWISWQKLKQSTTVHQSSGGRAKKVLIWQVGATINAVHMAINLVPWMVYPSIGPAIMQLGKLPLTLYGLLTSNYWLPFCLLYLYWAHRMVTAEPTETNA